MLSKNKIKLIHSMNQKKSRDESSLFLVEGNKMVEEALRSSFQVELLVCTAEFSKENESLLTKVKELVDTDSESIRKASLQQNPQQALAIVRQPLNDTVSCRPDKELVLGLDFIQDPGNLGTILRICDWFGLQTVICSENTVDVYNPKVVQASMGAIFRIKTWSTDLPEFLIKQNLQGTPVYGTFLDGKNIYSESLTNHGVLIMGNEGNGISVEVAKFVNQRLLIPRFPSVSNSSESLNVAVATAICCSEFRRRI